MERIIEADTYAILNQLNKDLSSIDNINRIVLFAYNDTNPTLTYKIRKSTLPKKKID